jgi:hypothetical protein
MRESALQDFLARTAKDAEDCEAFMNRLAVEA